jgi:hypothetical protein
MIRREALHHKKHHVGGTYSTYAYMVLLKIYPLARNISAVVLALAAMTSVGDAHSVSSSIFQIRHTGE